MKLPNAERAIVTREKVAEYVLNQAHPENGGKAAFFRMMGFSSGDWEALAEALREILANGTVLKSIESVHGRKFIVDSEMATPSGRRPRVRTVWIIDAGFQDPRLVTAYPAEG